MKDKRNILIVALLISILAMSIGYAALAQQLVVKGTANAVANWNVKITDITPRALTGANLKEGTPTFNNTSANFEVDLEYPGANATFDITIENAGRVDAILDSITGIAEANAESPEYIKYSISGINEKDSLDADSKVIATVTVIWEDDGQPIPETSVSKTATINLNYIQAE